MQKYTEIERAWAYIIYIRGGLIQLYGMGAGQCARLASVLGWQVRVIEIDPISYIIAYQIRQSS